MHPLERAVDLGVDSLAGAACNSVNSVLARSNGVALIGSNDGGERYLRVGLLEDDQAQARLIAGWLGEAGLGCLAFDRARPFLEVIRQRQLDLLIIDWGLPDIPGDEVLVRVREELGWSVPVLFITGRDREEDVVEALARGADDYMTKPVKRGETLARVSALLPRSTPVPEQGVFEFAPFSFDTRNGVVERDGEPVELTAREFSLALYLFRNAGRLLSRSQLLESVWGHRVELSTRTVDTHVSRVRRKLPLDPSVGWRVRSVYQHGYRLETVARDRS